HPEPPVRGLFDQAIIDQGAQASGVEFAPRERLETGYVDSLAQPESHEEKLVALFLSRKRLVLYESVTFTLDDRQPHLRVFLGCLRPSPLRGYEPAVSAGPHANIFAIAPIDQIVSAFSSRFRVV